MKLDKKYGNSQLNRNPLVSILAITYNSSRYILDALNSAKFQTYKNIELIISDDGSTDSTLEICENWIKENKQFFVRTEIITVSENTGITHNCNRGLKKSHGKWLKVLAGDDILLPNCIQDNINFTETNKEAKFVFSTYRYLINDIISKKYYFNRSFFLKNNKQQYNSFLKGVGVNTATSFFSRKDVIKLDGYNNDYPFLEDAPLWLKALKNGYKLYAFEKATVLYRIHPQNSSLTSKNIFINLNYYYSFKNFYNDKVKSVLIENKNYVTLFSNYIEFYIKDSVIKKGNKRTDYGMKLRLLKFLNIKWLFGLNGYFNKYRDQNSIKNNFLENQNN